MCPIYLPATVYIYLHFQEDKHKQALPNQFLVINVDKWGLNQSKELNPACKGHI